MSDQKKTCDSSVLQSALSKTDSFSRSSVSGITYCDSEIQSEARDLREEVSCFGSYAESSNVYPYRYQLEQDVQILQQQLQDEMELHAFLKGAVEREAAESSHSSDLPQHAQELISNIAALESTVSKLEGEMVSLHFQLSQERNERRLVEYRMRHSSSPSTSSSSRCSKHSNFDLYHPIINNSRQIPRNKPSESTGESSSTESMTEDAVDLAVALFHDKKVSKTQSLGFKKLPKGMPLKGLWDHPNQLSEEMVRCMKNIFISLADTIASSSISSESRVSSSMSPRGHLSNSSWWSSSERSIISSWVHSPQVDILSNLDVLASENVFDPYAVRGKLSWQNIGNYGSATEVSWMSVGKKQLEYASGALRGFRTLVEQLARVNPVHLSSNEKLAFWINLYNALIMHAYLAYGVPRSELKLFSLMQKAAYTVGGHSYSAAAIEYVILKMKPPLHRPQISLLLAIHKLKLSDEKRKAAVTTHEPLVSFALSCGMYSSPAVRIYKAKDVREELEYAQRDFIQASVGVSSKGKILVPKMLHCFAKTFVDDSNLAVWISRYLPPHQAAFVEQCISQRRQRLISSRNCGILPFDSRFRYLFLPDKISSSVHN